MVGVSNRASDSFPRPLSLSLPPLFSFKPCWRRLLLAIQPLYSHLKPDITSPSASLLSPVMMPLQWAIPVSSILFAGALPSPPPSPPHPLRLHSLRRCSPSIPPQTHRFALTFSLASPLSATWLFLHFFPCPPLSPFCSSPPPAGPRPFLVSYCRRMHVLQVPSVAVEQGQS